MFLPLLAAALAAATPTVTPAAIDDAITTICIARFAENVALVENGEEPRSLVIPLMGLDESMAAMLTMRCDMFDRGIAFAIKVQPQVHVRAPAEEREGLAPDHSRDPARFSR